jgi:hypothetical protein
MAPAKKQAAAPASAKRGSQKPPATPKKLTRKEKHELNAALHKKTRAEVVAKHATKVQRNPDGHTIKVMHGDIPRPTKYDEELANKICMMFATDPDMSLTRMNADPTLPTVWHFYEWCDSHSQLSKSFARSREVQIDIQAERLKDISRAPMAGIVKVTRVSDKDGTTTETRESDNIERTRLIIDTEKWIASKLRPKKYGAQPVELEANDALKDLLGAFRNRSKEIEESQG